MDNIEFVREVSAQAISAHLAERLNNLTDQRRVLWLVPGGSAAKIASLVSQKLRNPERITVSLTDERYGPPDHKDSNWRHLKEQAFMFPPLNYEILTGQSLTATSRAFNSFLIDAIRQKAYIFALLGMGPDGHIAGILPNSTALKSRDWAVAYEGVDFTRITTTPAFIRKLNEAYVYAIGQEKQSQLKKLSADIDIAEQPAQLLKRVPRVIFFTDLHNG